MIRIDRKILRAIISLTDSYDDEILYDEASSSIQVIRNFHNVVRSRKLDISPAEVPGSLSRLISLGYLEISTKFMGGYFFSITPLLKHRRAFWWDGFSKKFWGGFVTGIISGILIAVLGGLLLEFVRSILGI